jgi:DNA modification methylase
VRDWELIHGDCRAELPRLEGGSIDAVVVDPPYGINFMSADWDDAVAFRPGVWAECLRVAKAGAYLLAFGGTRTHHRLMCAVEDAGWVLTDTLCWLHGQGFPKSKGCLKPSWEPIVLARKAAPRVVPLGIDECRLPVADMAQLDERRAAPLGRAEDYCGGNSLNAAGTDHGGRRVSPQGIGRWPPNVALSHHEACVCRGTRRVRGTNPIGPNPGKPGYSGGFGRSPGHDFTGPDGTEEVEDWVCHPECPVFLLDVQAGERNSGGPQSGKRYPGQPGGWAGGPRTVSGYTDSGNASRFFYVSKASRADRGEGNDHNTVKPTALMQWLVKLACSAGGLVLDCFAGSGSTGVAALRCGRRFLGIERDPHYHAVALKRLAGVDGPLFAAAPAREEE